MIVELNCVGLEAEAHPAAFGAPSAVDRDLTGKCRVRLAPQEVQDVGGAQGGGGHQLALEGLQGRPVGEQDIAGVLTLIDQ